MPLNYRARCKKKMTQAAKNLIRAMEYIAEARASVVAEHPRLAQTFDNVLQDVDFSRHNLTIVTERIFQHARALPYEPSQLTGIVKDAKPLRRLRHN